MGMCFCRQQAIELVIDMYKQSPNPPPQQQQQLITWRSKNRRVVEQAVVTILLCLCCSHAAIADETAFEIAVPARCKIENENGG